jgi:peptidoglycan/xylan/chitin deacetylase (PgdA/CDA1 family)
MSRPQLLLGFLLVCLLTGGASHALAHTNRTQLSVLSGPQVRGAQTHPFPPINCTAERCIALTFDDGPHAVVTPKVLDILKEEQVNATFYVVGSRVAGREHYLQRAYSEGHEIGNHSWNHPMFTKLSPAQIEWQLHKTQEAIMRAGVPAPHTFRPPYGAVNAAVLAHVDLPTVRWNIDPADWDVRDAAKVRQGIIGHAKPGGIVLLHDTHISTAHAMRGTIRELKRQGYQFVTASQMLQVTPGDRGDYTNRP